LPRSVTRWRGDRFCCFCAETATSKGRGPASTDHQDHINLCKTSIASILVILSPPYPAGSPLAPAVRTAVGWRARSVRAPPPPPPPPERVRRPRPRRGRSLFYGRDIAPALLATTMESVADDRLLLLLPWSIMNEQILRGRQRARRRRRQSGRRRAHGNLFADGRGNEIGWIVVWSR
jgi:hypothetical protein